MKNEAKPEECTREFSEESAALRSKPDEMIIDPAKVFAHRWNELFLAASIVALFIDLLYLMVPKVKQDQICIADGLPLQLNLTCIRSVTDLFYLISIVVRFRTAYVEPSSRVLGRGELVLDPWKIALRYLRFNFWVDLAALLPLPQVYQDVQAFKLRRVKGIEGISVVEHDGGNTVGNISIRDVQFLLSAPEIYKDCRSITAKDFLLASKKYSKWDDHMPKG